MKTLDRYIIRQFLINFAILFAVLMLLYMVVDLIVDVDEFVEAGRRWAEHYGGVFPATLAAIGTYHGPMIVLIYVFFSGLLVVGAAGFTLSAMLRNREVLAMVAGGVSLYRIAAPILVVGMALNALSLPLQELLIPRLAPQLARSKAQIKYGAITSFPVRLAPDENGSLFSAAEFDAEGKTLTGLAIEVRNERGITIQRITAEKATWVDDAAPQGWRLDGGHVFEPDSARHALSAVDAPPRPIEFFPTQLSPTVLLARRASIYPQLLSMAQLQVMQANPAVAAADRAQITRTIWSRFSLLVVNVLILVMGLVFFLQIGQVNLLVQAALTAAVCPTVWGLAIFMLQFDSPWMNPVAWAWLPAVLYLPLASVMLQFVRT